MQHSTWDLEVHASEMQQRRQLEADRARQIDAARKRGHQTGVSPKRFSILQLVTAFRDSLAPQRRSTADAAPPAVAENQVLPILVQESRLSPVARSDALSQPYAGMMVLARGTSAQSRAQPCAASDC
jgi:hypothetical protein